MEKLKELENEMECIRKKNIIDTYGDSGHDGVILVEQLSSDEIRMAKSAK